MAKKSRKTLDEYLLHFHFKDTNEYIIFLIWALFVSAFLITILKK